MQNSHQASQEEITLYCLIGEALCMIQYLEDGLSHAITLKEIKKTGSQHLEAANQLLAEHRSYTLGKAIKLIKQKNLFPILFQKSLEEFLIERNWLVHKSIAHDPDVWISAASRHQLFNRIKSISANAQSLLTTLENDLINFSEEMGVDMSVVKKVIKDFH